MNLSTVVGHQAIIDRFAQWVKNDRLASTYLLVGPHGIGKRAVATWIAKALLCQQTDPTELSACGRCPDCQQVDALTHPDFLVVEKPPEKNDIPVELFIGTREKRMRAGLCRDISIKPFRGGRRIAIIDDADFLNQEGANCLLKTLEEPPPSSVIFLIANSEHSQLPTIRSRSQIIRFQPLHSTQVQQILQEKDLLPQDVSPSEIAVASQGSMQRALQLADPEIFEFRRHLLEQLASLDPGANDFFEDIATFVDSAGKDGPAKRGRLRMVAEFASRFYRNVMVSLTGQIFESDDIMCQCVATATENWPGDAESAAGCADRCSLVRQQIASNANQALVIESLLYDLGRIVRGELSV